MYQLTKREECAALTGIPRNAIDAMVFRDSARSSWVTRPWLISGLLETLYRMACEANPEASGLWRSRDMVREWSPDSSASGIDIYVYIDGPAVLIDG
jgi:hypothetical protein